MNEVEFFSDYIVSLQVFPFTQIVTLYNPEFPVDLSEIYLIVLLCFYQLYTAINTELNI